MDSVVKAFLGVFFRLTMMFLGVGLIGAAIDAGKAENFATDTATRISNSNFSESVIQACKEDAAAEGYQCQVELVRPSDRQRPTYGTLTLTYPFRIPLLSFEARETVTEDIL